MTEIIVVCGRQDSGKTTWVERLIPVLQRRGFHVGSVKHTHHDYAVVGKDTTRHQNAGASRVVLASRTGGAIYERWDAEPDLEELAERFFSGFDLVFAEGYRSSPLPKIVVGNDDVNESGLLANVRAIHTEGLSDDEVLAAAGLIEEFISQRRNL